MGQSAPAVIVIDLQIGMMDGVRFPPLHDHEQILARTAAVIGWARDRGCPVAYARHDGAAGEALERGAPGWPIHPLIAPNPDEPVFSKTVGDAFAPGALEGWLRDRAVDTVVLMGAQTDQCVKDTFGGALARGFAVKVVADAHSTWDWGGETAAQIVARYNVQFAAAGAEVVEAAALTRQDPKDA
jgi:nicotinamidase-related amidase